MDFHYSSHFSLNYDMYCPFKFIFGTVIFWFCRCQASQMTYFWATLTSCLLVYSCLYWHALIKLPRLVLNLSYSFLNLLNSTHLSPTQLRRLRKEYYKLKASLGNLMGFVYRNLWFSVFAKVRYIPNINY